LGGTSTYLSSCERISFCVALCGGGPAEEVLALYILVLHSGDMAMVDALLSLVEGFVYIPSQVRMRFVHGHYRSLFVFLVVYYLFLCSRLLLSICM
jgi:hypothetical protein